MVGPAPGAGVVSGRVTAAEDDHALAARLADQVGRALLTLRDDAFAQRRNPWQIEDDGDRLAHRFLVEALARHRPDDRVLSEEGVDDPARLTSPRVWIVDPLDGSHDFGSRTSPHWAVHVALVADGVPLAGAVSLPAMARLYSTALEPVRAVRRPDDPPTLITARSYSGYVVPIAQAIGARLVTCGSAGVKAMAVVAGDADVYVHASGLYEWDVCAPAAVAAAAGLHVSTLDGDPIIYNKPYPVVDGLVICRPELAAATLAAV